MLIHHIIALADEKMCFTQSKCLKDKYPNFEVGLKSIIMVF